MALQGRLNKKRQIREREGDSTYASGGGEGKGGEGDEEEDAIKRLEGAFDAVAGMLRQHQEEGLGAVDASRWVFGLGLLSLLRQCVLGLFSA